LLQESVWSLILKAGFFSKAILLSLLLLSIASWAFALNKYWQLRACSEGYLRALNLLRPTADLQLMYSKLAKEIGGAVGRIFEEGYLTLKSHLEGLVHGKPHLPELPADAAFNLFEKDVSLRLQTATESELAALASGLSLLATTVTISPFIGLLGTVWGVMYTFLSIGQSGSTELAVVAPGIAEALIATIAGLAVAIPALACNNFLAARLAKLEDNLARFNTELNIYFTHNWQREKTKIGSRLGNQRDAAR
jgi:biopolymer transport protein TolQ